MSRTPAILPVNTENDLVSVLLVSCNLTCIRSDFRRLQYHFDQLCWGEPLIGGKDCICPDWHRRRCVWVFNATVCPNAIFLGPNCYGNNAPQPYPRNPTKQAEKLRVRNARSLKPLMHQVPRTDVPLLHLGFVYRCHALTAKPGTGRPSRSTI